TRQVVLPKDEVRTEIVTDTPVEPFEQVYRQFRYGVLGPLHPCADLKVSPRRGQVHDVEAASDRRVDGCGRLVHGVHARQGVESAWHPKLTLDLASPLQLY